MSPVAPECPICGTALHSIGFAARDRLHGTPGEHHVATCPSCCAGVSLPLVADSDLAAFYPSGYGPYDERMGRWQRAVSRWIRRFQGWSAMRSAPMEALNGLSAGRALDVGCGRGDLASTLATRGWKMTGIDPSPAACAAARARGIDARCGTLSTVPLEPAAFGAAIFHHSLEHVHDPVAALRAVAAALAPAGLVLITVPNFECWQARRFAGYWYHLDLPRHRVHFTRAALQRALLSAGLEVVAFSTSTTAVGLPASIQYRVLDRCLFPSGLGLRIASGWCAVMLPVAALLDRAFGAGDVLHVVARLSPARTEMASSSTSDIRRAGPG